MYALHYFSTAGNILSSVWAWVAAFVIGLAAILYHPRPR